MGEHSLHALPWNIYHVVCFLGVWDLQCVRCLAAYHVSSSLVLLHGAYYGQMIGTNTSGS